jgi:hypothetical protein
MMYLILKQDIVTGPSVNDERIISCSIFCSVGFFTVVSDKNPPFGPIFYDNEFTVVIGFWWQ